MTGANYPTTSAGLNPCSTGRWFRSRREQTPKNRSADKVLILVLLEDGFGGNDKKKKRFVLPRVLILVLLEDGFGVMQRAGSWIADNSLNPCFTGRWSRRRFGANKIALMFAGLNPCSTGRWFRSYVKIQDSPYWMS